MKIAKKTTKMGKTLVSLIFRFILMLLALGIAFGVFYWYENRLFLWEAALKWKQEPLVLSTFKDGSTELRSRMVVGLIDSKEIIGLESQKVTDLLGDETGDYYYSDSNLTYKLTDNGNADWILTMVVGDDGKVEKIFIRKSCCSISRKLFNYGLRASEVLF